MFEMSAVTKKRIHIFAYIIVFIFGFWYFLIQVPSEKKRWIRILNEGEICTILIVDKSVMHVTSHITHYMIYFVIEERPELGKFSWEVSKDQFMFIIPEQTYKAKYIPSEVKKINDVVPLDFIPRRLLKAIKQTD